MPDVAAPFVNPAGWPDAVLPILQRAIACEYASVTTRGAPVTLPVTPYLGDDGRTLDFATGLTYPAKAERARRDPRVALLFSDPVGSGLRAPPVVLVQGLGAVRDSDLQANADRYVRLSLDKIPALYKQLPWFMISRQRWYWTRIWVHITPMRIFWWPEGRMDAPPQRWDAPAGTRGEPSDPAPPGHQPPPWKPIQAEWRPRAEYALRRLGIPVVTVMDAQGFPVPVRVEHVSLKGDGFELALPASLPALAPAAGPACLTFHEHDPRFAREENATFLGRLIQSEQQRAVFHVERVIGDLSAPGAWPRRVVSLLSNGVRLMPRLRAEAARRGQPIPRVRRPRGVSR
jgi:hypothetical protein